MMAKAYESVHRPFGPITRYIRMVRERLKRLFARRRRAVDVAYDTESKDAPPVMPAAPPTTPYPPAAPMNEPKQEPPE